MGPIPLLRSADHVRPRSARNLEGALEVHLAAKESDT